MTPITDPTALADQLDAAGRDARAAVAEMTAITGGPLTHTHPPAWLHGHLSALRTALHDGTARPCPHLAGGPGIAYAAVWAPGVLACPTCAPTLLQPDQAEDLRCDACRRPGPGGGHLHPGLVVSGPVLLAYGLCPDCRHLTNPHHQPQTTPRTTNRNGPSTPAPTTRRSRHVATRRGKRRGTR